MNPVYHNNLHYVCLLYGVLFLAILMKLNLCCMQWCTEFQSLDKVEPNSLFRGKYIHNNLIRIQVSLICKLSGTPDLGATALRSLFYLPPVLN
jgi:hypothetical protein